MPGSRVRHAGVVEDDELEARVRAALDARGAPYRVMPCDPAYADTAAFCQRYGIAPEDSANCILVAGKGAERRYAVCLVLAVHRLDVNGVVRKRLGVKKASFASPEETIERTDGMQIGGVTPIGLPAGLPIWVDPKVMERDEIVVGGGSRACKVVLPPAALLGFDGIEVVEGLAR
jgi:prolyl-tRNA editing enzyme YbaK/EbsC (Cys-tRNA(Pro) deacylase)